jgi:hypothetical protein
VANKFLAELFQPVVWQQFLNRTAKDLSVT